MMDPIDSARAELAIRTWLHRFRKGEDHAGVVLPSPAWLVEDLVPAYKPMTRYHLTIFVHVLLASGWRP